MASEALGAHTEIVMGQSPPGDACNATGNGTPLLNGPTEYGPHHPTPVQFTTDVRKLARPGDILFCVRGSTTGRMNWADQEYAIGRGVAAIRHKAGRDYQPFVRAVIEFGLPGLLVQATGSTFPNVSAQQLSNLWWPPIGLSEQRAVAHILGTLEDKIELNRRMCATLEAMAQALFKAWFVDFEPVRAKAEGRDPGLPPQLATLFPNRLVEAENGEIPEGWTVRTVEEIMELAYGKALKASERIRGPVPVYGSGGITGYHDKALVNGPSIIVGRKGSVGTLYWEDSPFFPIDTVFYVRPKAPLTFCFCHLQTLGLEAMNTDAAVPGLNRSNVYRLPVPWSDDALRSCFDRIVLDQRRRMRVANDEIRTLAALRDTLLPQLISGELRVKDAHTFLDRVL